VLKEAVRRWGRGRMAAVLGVALAAVAVGFLTGPAPAPSLSSRVTGDLELAAKTRALAGERGRRGLSVALIREGSIRTAGLGDSGDAARSPVTDDTVFEIGSVSKALTGMLLADLQQHGVIRLDRSLRELLPERHFADPAIGAANLEDLAGHRSGLPRIPTDPSGYWRAFGMRWFGLDPYRGIGADRVLAAAAASTARDKGRFAYSNLGMAVAGQAAARATGTRYEDLLRRRVLDPLGMRHSFFVGPADPLPTRTATGRTADGAAMEHWRAGGYAPAGGLWSTSTDLSRLLNGMITGTAPGASAAVPRHGADHGNRIGLGWFTKTIDGHTISWHNGGTGGFTSFVGFDRDARSGVVVLSNTDRSVDEIGLGLLGLHPPIPKSNTVVSWALQAVGQRPGADTDGHVLFSIAAALVALLLPGVVLLRKARRTPQERLDRVRVFTHVCFGLAVFTLYRHIGPWSRISPMIWTVGAALFLLGAWGCALRWRDLPTCRTRPFRWVKAGGLAVQHALILIGLTGSG